MAIAINLRSPRIVTINGSVNDTTKVEIYLWNDPDSIPVQPTYTLDKVIVDAAVGNVYDISPYCRRFVNHTAYTPITSDTAMDVNEYAYCSLKLYRDGAQVDVINDFICFDGFGYHSEGVNPEFDHLLPSGTYIVNGDSGASLSYYESPDYTWTYEYSALSGTTGITSFGNTVGHIPLITPGYNNTTANGNLLEVFRDGILVNSYNVIRQTECKYEVMECDFVNKFGAWQRVSFFKASKSSFDVKSTEYNLMPSSTSYNVQDNVRSGFNFNGNEKISVNSGWVPESYSDSIQQLMLSEKVLLNDVPVLVSSKSIELQKNISNKNINYKLDFTYSAPKLNYNI